MKGCGQMDYQAFVKRVAAAVRPGHQFQNPGGGVSTVKSLVVSGTQENLYYVRGRSTIQVSLRDLYDAFMAFRGQTCATTDLRRFRPEVFDSKAKGHSCNCTLFFLLLQEVGLAGEIFGAGVRGQAFRTLIS